MKNKPAFTIIEVLIALCLSSIIIFGMVQAYNNVMRYLTIVQEMQSVGRKVCLLFNQIERDFSTAFIPPLLALEKTEKETDANLKNKGTDEGKQTDSSKVKTPDEKEKEDLKKREKLKIYFTATINENELPKKINEQLCYPFKTVSFINTNPLQIYGQRRIRVVRVFYELVLDKAKSKGENLCYKLYRKETEDLENFKLKEDETEAAHDKRKIVRKHLIADGVKSMFLQYIYQGYKKENQKSTKKEIEERIYNAWGDKQETFGILPCRINIVISFWDEKLTKSITMEAMFPVVDFSLYQDEEKPEGTKETKKSEKPEEQGQKVQAQPQQHKAGQLANPPF